MDYEKEARTFHRRHIDGVHARDCESMCSEKIAAFGRRCAEEALERAAREIERLSEEDYDPESDWAASVRALKDARTEREEEK